MAIFKSKTEKTKGPMFGTRPEEHPFTALKCYTPLAAPQMKLYYSLREAVPLIDAAILKTVRLAGGYKVKCESKEAGKKLDEFLAAVPVGGNRQGIYAFTDSYLEQLLTCGTALGEIVTDAKNHIAGLYNAPLENVEFRRNPNGFDVDIYTVGSGTEKKVERPELCLMSVLNPDPGAIMGNSLLKGLPFVSGILLKIFESIGTNWERAGNIRYAVTYNPGSGPMDKAYAAERADRIAQEWSKAMRSGSEVRDFVAVGDVQIRVIGADNAVLDSSVPVRQMLEQIVAKTGIPPFMLGLSWSSTERMSAQQADILTSELEAYRRILTPVIIRICTAFLRSEGYSCSVEPVWDDITLQDEVETARAENLRDGDEERRAEE